MDATASGEHRLEVVKSRRATGAECVGKLTAVLIISIFLLAAISFALYRTKRHSLKGMAEQDLFPPSSRGLFADEFRGAASGDRGAVSAVPFTSADYAARLREAAGRGELAALREAWATDDRNLYDEVLALLLKRDASVENVRAVAAYVIGGEPLRANTLLAGAMRTLLKLSPEYVSVTDLLRVAALSDDAGVFRETVEEVVEAWEQGRVPEKSAEDLRLLFESEYWVLAPEALRSGAGFRLKQELAEVRRRLAAGTGATESLHKAGEVGTGNSLR